jgi:hypothetical protein
MPLEFRAVDYKAHEIMVEQSAPDIECPIVDLRDGRTLYVVWLSLAAERSGMRLYDYRLEPPWPDHDFQQLPNFADSHVGDYYRLPGGLEYPRAEVLNLNFLKEGWRLPNTRVEGALCALSATPIPQEYRHGASIPVGLRFFDRAGQQLAAASLVLWADRWRERAVTRPTATPPVAVDVAEQSVAGRPPRSSLYGPSGGYVVPAADQRQGNEAPRTAGAREGSSRTGLLGE